MMTAAEKQKAYRARLKAKSALVDRQCDRLRRILTDFPEFLPTFDTWMKNRVAEIPQIKAKREASKSA